jgi:hypothetical protein
MSFDKLQSWHEFYAVTAGVAATLMGLMFVVVSLGQRSLATEEGSRAARALHTPIIVFFVTVIIVSMLMLMPGTAPAALAALLAVVSVCGLIYMVISGAYTLWRESTLGFDDLIWYVALPYVSYAMIGVASIMIWSATPFGPHVEAAATILLLLVGIRNAWDLVVYSARRGGGD